MKGNSVVSLYWTYTPQHPHIHTPTPTLYRDTRERSRQMLTVNAHENDVNVLSWNRDTSFMLASGAEDGTLRVWDLRNFKDGSFVANFAYHR